MREQGRRLVAGSTVLAVVAAAAALTVAAKPAPPESSSPPFPAFGPATAMPPVDGDPDGRRSHHVVTVDPAAADGEPATTASGRFALHVPEASLSDNDRQVWAALSGAGQGRAPIGDRLQSVPGVTEVKRVDATTYTVAGEVTAEAIAQVAGVVDVTPDPLGMLVGNDPHFGQQWGLRNDGQVVQGQPGVAGADISWDEAAPIADGRGIVVAVVDTGVEVTHPDLAARMWSNPGEVCGNGVDDDANGYVDDCQGWDLVNGDGSVYDAGANNAHGTHVAGTIAATTGDGVGAAGVAPRATIMSVKISEGGSFPMSRAAEGIRYAVANGAHVINASWGSPPGSPSSPLIDAAIAEAEAAGVLLVVAAGNDGVNIDVAPSWPAGSTSPNVLTVGASTNQERIASFSNHGARNVDLFAPGQAILAPYPGGWAHMSGTSMATPMTAGVAALVAQHRGTTHYATIRQAILDGVDKRDAYRGASVTGGRLSAAGALGANATPRGDLEASFTGLDAVVPGPVSATVTATLPEDVAADASLTLSLGVWHDGQVRGVVDHDVTLTVGGTAQAARTGGLGEVTVPLSAADRQAVVGGLGIGLDTTLPAGRYALLVAAESPQRTLTSTAALFTVADPSEAPAPAPAPPGGDAPGSGTPPSGGSTPPSESGPGTVAPIGSGPGTAPPGGGSEPITFQPAPLPGTPLPGGSTPIGGVTPPPGGSTPPPSGPAPQDPGGFPVPGPVTGSDPTGPLPGPGAPPVGSAPGGGGGTAPGTSEPDGPWPSTGPTTGGTHVKIVGNYGIGARVTFAGRLAPLLVVTPSYVIVTSPAHPAGPVDVVVTSSGVEVQRYVGGFTYIADGAVAPAPAPAPAPPPGGGGTPPGGATPGSGPATSPAGPSQLENGLVVAGLPDGHPLRRLREVDWSVYGCTADPCGGVGL